MNSPLRQIHGWNLVPPHQDADCQPASCLYVDGTLYVDDSQLPEDLDLQAILVQRCSPTALYDMLPMSRGQLDSSPGSVAHPLRTHTTHSNLGLGPIHVSVQDQSTCLTQKASPVKRNKHHSRLCLRKKRSRSRLVASPGKRLKPCSRQPTEAKTSSDPIHPPASEALSNEQSLAGACDDSDSEDEDPWGLVSEEDAEDIRLGDTERITAFIRQTADCLGQLLLKTILKAMIKMYEPGKQTKFPYNGGDRPSDEPRNLGRDTAPPWWPEQAHWKEGLGCRHREPDHVFKKGRSLCK